VPRPSVSGITAGIAGASTRAATASCRPVE
jgi:hypothetical protein